MKTTEKHFKIFKEECDLWLKFFGILDWEIHYEHDGGDARANCYTDQSGGQIATLELCKKWETIPTDLIVRKCAFHEVCELMLSEMSYGLGRHYSWDISNKMTHRVIRRMENSIFNNHNLISSKK